MAITKLMMMVILQSRPRLSPFYATQFKTLTECCRLSPVRANIGCVFIEILDPEEYDFMSMKRTSFALTGWTSHFDYQTTSYCGECPDMKIMRLNRQIYEEASDIFYSKNMFYFDSLDVIIPFLRDRGSRAITMLRKISMPYHSPAGMRDRASHARIGEHQMAPFVDLEYRWEETCQYLSTYVTRLSQLDLRVIRECSWYHAKNHPQSLQGPNDFPRKRRQELATLRPTTRLTISDYEWNEWKDLSPEFVNPLFTPLRQELQSKIMRCRGEHLSNPSIDSPSRHNAAADFWGDRQRRRKVERFCRPEYPETENSHTQPYGWTGGASEDEDDCYCA